MDSPESLDRTNIQNIFFTKKSIYLLNTNWIIFGLRGSIMKQFQIQSIIWIFLCCFFNCSSNPRMFISIVGFSLALIDQFWLVGIIRQWETALNTPPPTFENITLPFPVACLFKIPAMSVASCVASFYDFSKLLILSDSYYVIWVI